MDGRSPGRLPGQTGTSPVVKPSRGERAKRVPDLTVTLGAKRAADMGRTQAVIGLSIPLPLLDRNQGNLLEHCGRGTRRVKRWQRPPHACRPKSASHWEAAPVARTVPDAAQGMPCHRDDRRAAVKNYGWASSPSSTCSTPAHAGRTQQNQLRSTADTYRAAAELDRLLGLHRRRRRSLPGVSHEHGHEEQEIDLGHCGHC